MNKRLDVLLAQRGIYGSRERAQTAVKCGRVSVDGLIVYKPGLAVSENAVIDATGDPVGFVSRGGLKLQKALHAFGISVDGAKCADIGASSGGFTDCMLKNGAANVWAIDVGHEQLDPSLRGDRRVTVMEGVNIRCITPESIGDTVDFCAIDVSFISLRLVLPAVKTILSGSAKVIALVKPQFEAGRERLGKNGVVRDNSAHIEVLTRFLLDAEASGFNVHDLTYSPIKGSKGNTEFLALLSNSGTSTAEYSAPAQFDIKSLVTEAARSLRHEQ